MDGTLVIEQGSIADFLVARPVAGLRAASRSPGRGRSGSLRYLWRRLAQFNPPTRSRANVAHHYDLDQRLYALFLDADRQYSCAYFEHPEQSLDDAQLAKKRHVAAKLLVEARRARARHRFRLGRDGTLSRRDVRRAGDRRHAVRRAVRARRARAPRKRGSRDRVEFRLQDYRDIAERFDRIVSVGMFEHVGVGYYDVVLPQMRRAARRRRRDAAALDRPLGRSRHHQSVDRKVHFPRRLHPRAVGGAARGRARRTSGHRHRDPAPALRRDAEALARRASSRIATIWRRSTTRGSSACGNSISRPPRCRSASRT